MTYHVFFRACDKVGSIHGLPRPFGLDKRQLIELCFKSLMYNFPEDSKLTILADKCSEELIDFFNNHARNLQVEIIRGDWGNDNSLMKMFELAENLPDDDIVYFVEDDYLHAPNFWERITNLHDVLNKDFFIHPTDYPDQYFRTDLIIPAHIFVTSTGHWRQVSSTTFTFMCRARLVTKYLSHMKSSTVNADDGFLSQIFRETPCFCPLPGLATHMHEGTMSLFVNWEAVKNFYEQGKI